MLEKEILLVTAIELLHSVDLTQTDALEVEAHSYEDGSTRISIDVSLLANHKKIPDPVDEYCTRQLDNCQHIIDQLRESLSK